MTFKLIIGLLILVGGIVLLVMGLNATDTFGEEVQKEITGDYSDDTQWHLYVGGAGILVGIGLTAWSFRKSRAG